ncbi:MAG: DUF302 domain-containing protein [Myxococcales bacterium]|nr:DUF302 domain-containing protein [Myxococcales bacterium]MDD9969067.1 DUF302 domain-containing protein [Myxococcales bacterium]
MRTWLGWIWILGLVSQTAAAQSPSEAAATAVVDRVALLTERMAELGFEQELVIDHAAAAGSVGLTLLPTQVVFFSGNRTAASLVGRRPTVALDLPLRALVYADEAGAVHVERDDIGVLIDRHEVPLGGFALRWVDTALDRLAEEDTGLVTVASERSVEDTTAALLAVLAERGFRVPLVIDYGERLGLPRPMRLVMFGNPNVGTPLMQSSRNVALDLPQKMLIFENEQGQVELVYNHPAYLARKHGVSGHHARLANIESALAAIATAAATAP